MTWNIPPVGWCAVCLVARREWQPAMLLWRGTGLCEEHLRDVHEEEQNMDLGQST